MSLLFDRRRLTHFVRAEASSGWVLRYILLLSSTLPLLLSGLTHSSAIDSKILKPPVCLIYVLMC